MINSFPLFSFSQILKHKISLLEESNAELRRELQERRITSDHLTQRALDAQVCFIFFLLLLTALIRFSNVFDVLFQMISLMD